ncbi:universal stress protein [Anabaena aphanizomenioides LEGE 00250]|jgi:nucleotide-binding universal stress UspA family protein|uniref:Universal stress protein n=1 Tax=Sphaerospermopsis aphanizomenoides LEGE 00250 TaxID=2777972 RepID=A0ABR9VCN9_9CYAN|nr:universal stress protein [Sphaerospermopsis aphanizomenoides]MBE9236243.1 universal stress protein [Sphaerospermopsis aphanizomenoides LEGE 00250]
MFHKILVALDNSERSQYIFDQALFLAQASEAEMMLLHVLSPLEDPYINPIFLQPETIYPTLHTETINQYMQAWDKLKQDRLDWMRSLTQTAIKAGVKTEFTQTVGDAGRVICELALSWPADLIIVGRRGRTGISEVLLGSVSNYVLHHAYCSVLTIQGLMPPTIENTENTKVTST